MIAAFEWTGLADKYFSVAKQAGPLATFDGADNWVPHPYRSGVVLLGDAAASNDPTWGQGLSLTLRGVRTLRDALRKTDDWETAGHAYAAEVDRFYMRTQTVTSWFRELFLETGEQAEKRRARALPLIAEDPTRVPDILLGGPDIRLGENARERLFGGD